ncbi:MAG TPA: carbon-nitrogen hydrolase family protein [Methylococcaceae bacterium]|nr:carbon-nitrogen hydrolase family protein [Methylococcaceae bacterium]
MASSPNVGANLLEAGKLVSRAAAAGAELVVLPENFAFMGLKDTDKLAHAEPEGSGPIQEFLSREAERHGVWLVGGTLPIEASQPGKVRAACVIFDAHGQVAGRYDKIHLFDVNVPGSEEQYRESETIECGSTPLVMDTPFGRLGVAICYDLRFPELFREMAEEGMDILAVPAAFTARTGAAHWEILVRARAVENLCHVVASNQGGFHLNGRETYGRSMIVGPWGDTLSCLPTGAGFACAEVDLDKMLRLRQSFPVLGHRRLSCRTAAPLGEHRP